MVCIVLGDSILSLSLTLWGWGTGDSRLPVRDVKICGTHLQVPCWFPKGSRTETGYVVCIVLGDSILSLSLTLWGWGTGDSRLPVRDV